MEMMSIAYTHIVPVSPCTVECITCQSHLIQTKRFFFFKKQAEFEGHKPFFTEIG